MMKQKKYLFPIILIVSLILLDQILKIWVKTSFTYGETLEIFTWFKLRFIENNGAAFGMQIASDGAFDWGKLLLSLFRVAMIGLLGYYIYRLIKRDDLANDELVENTDKKVNRVPRGVIIGLSLVIAGAIGNLLDSMFYGVMFSESTALTAAEWGNGSGSFMMGKVVDMFYFPLFQWENVPSALDFLVDDNNYFFGAIFNLADVYISVAVVYLLIFQYKFFNKE